MPARKAKEPKELPPFDEPTSEFQFNTGFRYGLSDNPPHLGETPIPIGKPDCLKDLTFAVTGTLPSCTREQITELIQRLGGRVTSSISGKTDILLRGCIEVGPKKLQDAKTRGIKIIDEESLFKYLQSTNPTYKPPPPPTIDGGIPLPEENFPASGLLSEKYRPRLLKDVVGNFAAIKHLVQFFEKFESDGDKASVIISGPPGIGKSTCAALVALRQGYNPIEFNASDTRSQKAIGEDVSDVFTNRSINEPTKLPCLIFDEVDGMSSGDRGGLQALANLIDKASIPVICICNDRNNRKLQILAKRSIDIKFTPPEPADIAQRLRFIADQEHIKASDNQLLEIAKASKGDVRHAINTLQFWTQKSETNDKGASFQDGKVVPLTDVVDACQKAYMPDESIDNRFEAYFVDYGIMPLYMYENIPVIEGKRQEYFEAIDSISQADVCESLIRESNTWGLLNADALFSTVIPGESSRAKGFGISVRFPSWFGKSSKAGRLERYTVEISSRTARTLSVSPKQLFNTTAPLLTELFLKYLKTKTPDIEGFGELLESLGLTLDDYEHLFEICAIESGGSNGPKINPIAPRVKAAVSQYYHSRHTDNQSKILKLSEVQADYAISKRPKKFTKSYTQKSTRSRGYDNDDEDDDGFKGQEEEDGDYTPNAESKPKEKKPKENAKSPKTKGKGKKRKDFDSEDEDDDGSDLVGFVVDDDEIEEEAPKRKKKEKEKKPKADFKPTKAVERKTPKPRKKSKEE